MVENIPSGFPPAVVAIAQALQRYLMEQHVLLQDVRELLTDRRPPRPNAAADACRRVLRNMDSEATLIRTHREFFFESYTALYREPAVAARAAHSPARPGPVAADRGHDQRSPSDTCRRGPPVSACGFRQPGYQRSRQQWPPGPSPSSPRQQWQGLESLNRLEQQKRQLLHQLQQQQRRRSPLSRLQRPRSTTDHATSSQLLDRRPCDRSPSTTPDTVVVDVE